MKKLTALLLALVMVLALCACGSDTAEAPAADTAAAPVEEAAPAEEAAPVEDAAPAAEEAPAGEAPEGGASSGEMDVEYFPSAGTDYTRDFEGYRQYCLDAFANDAFAPDDVKDLTNTEFESMTEENFQDGDRWQALIGLGVFDDYETFLAS